MQINKDPKRWAGLIIIIAAISIMGISNAANPVIDLNSFISLVIKNWYAVLLFALGLYWVIKSINKQNAK